ncbi:unnamed protein product, partial [Gulo gulo]
FSKNFHFIAPLLSWFLPSEVSPCDLITSYILRIYEREVELSKDSEERQQRPTSPVLTNMVPYYREKKLYTTSFQKDQS